MNAEAVRDDAIPSKQGLLRDESHPVNCSECNVAYLLHDDDEAKEISLSAAYRQRKLSLRAIPTMPLMSCSIWIKHRKEKPKWCGRPDPPCRVSSRRSPTIARERLPHGSSRAR